jgi:hypothetical protein
LGGARGVAVQTGSGHIFALVALDHAQKVHGPHFEVIAEGEVIIAVGVDALLDELLSSLSLTRKSILGSNPQATERAKRLIELKVEKTEPDNPD